jgi:chorismate mutase
MDKVAGNNSTAVQYILELLILVNNLDAMLIASSPRRLADGREMAVHGVRLIYIKEKLSRCR